MSEEKKELSAAVLEAIRTKTIRAVALDVLSVNALKACGFKVILVKVQTEETKGGN